MTFVSEVRSLDLTWFFHHVWHYQPVFSCINMSPIHLPLKLMQRSAATAQLTHSPHRHCIEASQSFCGINNSKYWHPYTLYILPLNWLFMMLSDDPQVLFSKILDSRYWFQQATTAQTLSHTRPAPPSHECFICNCTSSIWPTSAYRHVSDPSWSTWSLHGLHLMTW